LASQRRVDVITTTVAGPLMANATHGHDHANGHGGQAPHGDAEHGLKEVPQVAAHVRETWIENLRLLRRHGVPIAIGSDHAAGSGPGSPRDYSLGPPLIRTCPLKASGSSRCGSAVPRTTGPFRGDTRMRHDVLGVVPTPRPQRGAPFAPPGPEGRSPASRLLWGAATPCHPSRRASCASLGDTTVLTMERARSPKFPWNPFDHAPMLFDPGRIRQAEWTMG